MATDQHEIILENFILIYLNNEENNSWNIYRLQELVHLIYIFTNFDQCFDYITNIRNERIFLIISDRFCQNLLSIINEFEQIESIYLLTKTRNENEKWIENQQKIKGIYKDIQSIYEAIRRDLRIYQDDHIPISILSLTNPIAFDRLFFINQILEENSQIQIEKDFIKFCQNYYSNNEYQLQLIDQFQKTYFNVIQWFIQDCFLTNIFHKALRIRDISMIKKLDFFIQNLHKQIQIKSKQINLIVYRNQLITTELFDHILNNQQGYLVFHQFLIVITDRELALAYVNEKQTKNFIRILFQMEINEEIMCLNESDYFKQYLLTINTIFQINDIKQIENNLWNIKLKLIGNKNRTDLNKYFQFGL